MWDVGRSASTDVLSGTSSLVGAPDEVFGTHTLRIPDIGRSEIVGPGFVGTTASVG
jgi:hypothetical protein